MDEKAGLRQAEARGRRQVDGGILQGPLQRGRAEGGNSINMQFVEGSRSFKGTKAYGKKEALDHYRALRVPPASRSSIVGGRQQFRVHRGLEFAAESGVKFNAALRRATWKDGIPIYAQQAARPSKPG